jgi:excisionase family DNA binding protein
MSNLLSLAEVAAALRVSPETIRRAVRDGRLVPTATLSPKVRRFDPADVQRQLAAPAMKPAETAAV